MKAPLLSKKDFLNITDLSSAEIYQLFDFTAKIKREARLKKYRPFLKNQTLAMIFEKSSTRTRVSFETGMYQLGGQALFLSSNDIQLGRGETIADTARVLSRYVDGIMIRTFSQAGVEELARNSTIPVINGLTDSYHPCQALTDFFTMWEIKPALAGLKLAYVGDGNNMANTLLLGSALLGINFSIATPKGYQIGKDIIAKAETLAKSSGAKLEFTSKPADAAHNANFIYTDVWTSMGQEKESAKRKKIFAKYKIDSKLMSCCQPGCKILHCLPAHRGEEIDNDVIESQQSIVFEQAENRLHIQKAIMTALMKK